MLTVDNCTYNIVIITITVLWTLILFPIPVVGQSGDLYIHIHGASLRDNLKVSAQKADEYSWEWRDTFIFAGHFYKSVSGVSPGDEINVCLTNFNTGAEDCDSGTFNNNLSADVFVNIG